MTLDILWKAFSSHLFLWQIEGEWHCTSCERQSHHIFSYDKQPGVSDMSYFEWQSHHFFSYDQQEVSAMPYFVKGSSITSFPMTNRWQVIWHILWRPVSSHLFLWPTVCEWHCMFCEGQSHHIFSYDQQRVSDIHILWKAVSSHPFPWPTDSESHCTLCERQFHHIFPLDQQRVSDITHFLKGSVNHLISHNKQNVSLSDIVHFLKGSQSHLFLWPTDCEWHCIFSKRQSHHIFFVTNSKWVTLYILWKAVS